jgi:hypothetical protein
MILRPLHTIPWNTDNWQLAALLPTGFQIQRYYDGVVRAERKERTIGGKALTGHRVSILLPEAEDRE